MEEVDPDRFGEQIGKISTEDNNSLRTLWEAMNVRNPVRTESWIKWLTGDGPPPATTPQKPVVEGPQTNIELEMPQLSDALDTLDGANE